MVLEEFMGGVDVGPSTYISRLSYYALEDTGHWKVDVSDIPHFINPYPGAGCDFFVDACDSSYSEFICDDPSE